jgi:hypothetical protein
VRVVLVGGDELVVKIASKPVFLENDETEELAIARVTSALQSRDDNAV